MTDVPARRSPTATTAAGGEGVLVRLRRSSAYETLVCAALLVYVELGLRFLRLPRLADRLGLRLSTGPVPLTMPAALPPWTERCLRASYRVTSRWPAGPQGKCLRTSLIAGHRLRSLGPELAIGVRRGETRLRAHAWLVVCGGSLDPSVSDFACLTLERR